MRLVRFRSYLREVLDSGVQLVAYEDVLRHAGIAAECVHGAMATDHRAGIMARFRSGETQVRNGDPLDNRIENLELTTRQDHKRIHSEIGVGTRLKKQWHLDATEVVERFKHQSATEIAAAIGCNYKTVVRTIKAHSGITTDLRTTRPETHPASYAKKNRSRK